MGNLKTPGSIQKLQTALHAKAKGEPGYRFYLLYDKVHLKDVLVLAHAYACCRANKGAAGVDGELFDDIKACGEERWLGELAEALRKKTYQAQAVRRVYIPNARSDQPENQAAQPSVGDSMSPCPRAGCGKPASPVR